MTSKLFSVLCRQAKHLRHQHSTRKHWGHTRRRFSYYAAQMGLDLNEEYQRARRAWEAQGLPPDVNRNAVFANNQMDLESVEVYGFDYDYTLAYYKDTMDKLLYRLGREMLITKYNYPKAIQDMEYLPDFVIRGLHYDIQKGLLMKIDSFHQIQLGTVYKGLKALTDEEVRQLYGELYISVEYIEGHINNRKTSEGAKMQQLSDLFSIPEMGLLVNVTEYFERHNIPYDPEILFWDVKNAVGRTHPIMHREVEVNTGEYLVENPDLRKLFSRLVNGGKKLFLVTNSPFSFVDKGMRYLIGADWRDIFEIVVVQARKPKFFSGEARPFRVYNVDLQSQTWERVTKLEKGKVYVEGNVKLLQDLTSWHGNKVLYCGDQIYTDLSDVTLHQGWCTGAIISELGLEIDTLNSLAFKKTVTWLDRLQHLIEELQDRDDPESQAVIRQWEQERDMLRQATKALFNRQFGSMFRTYHNPTFFSRRLFRFADIYTSSVTNFLNYSLNHTFYPRRGSLPHEFRVISN